MANQDYPTVDQRELDAEARGIERTQTDAQVMFDARYIFSKITGIGRYTYNILREMLRIDESLRLHLITHPSRPEPFRSDRVTTQTVGWHAFSPLTRLALAPRLDFDGVDLFHSPFNFLPARVPVPSVLTLHDIMWLVDADFVASNWFERLFSAPFFQWCTKRSVRESERILTVSDHSRKEIEERFPATADRVHAAYNAVDESFEPVAPAEGWPVLNKFLPPRSKFVLSIGVQSPYKNHEGALAGFIEAFADDPQVYYVLVQRHTYPPKGRLRELLEHPKAGPRIIRLEYVSDAELRALYSLARAFLFPSLYEGFGLPILEAMTCGTPVVTSDYGAMAEVGGEAAVTVDPESPEEIAGGLRRLFDDDRFYEEKREAGFERTTDFTWERCARATLDAYRSILDQ